MNINELEFYVNQNMSTYRIAKEFGVGQTTIRYWLCKYNLKTYPKPVEAKTSKICPRCKEEKQLDHFYNRRNKEGNSPYCKICTNEERIIRFRSFKQQCVDYLGGVCQLCGYKKCIAALDFHHIDPSKKDFNIGHVKNNAFTSKITDELDKCMLLCSNCHREIHAGVA